MKRLYIIVEGQTEQSFVENLLMPYLNTHGIWDVHVSLIHTSKNGKGGFVNYQHLKNDVKRYLSSSKNDFIVTTFVDFFKIPELPNKHLYNGINDHTIAVGKMEECMVSDIRDSRFMPYIQLHEFEALLFSSNVGFENYFNEKESQKTGQIVDSYDNPEDINTTVDGAPSKRLLSIKMGYDKVIYGNLIALQIGIDKIIEKCPRFRNWINTLIAKCKDNY